VASGAVLALLALALAAPAGASHENRVPKRVVASGLNGPFGLDYGRRFIYVAEADAGQVTEIDPRTGTTRVVASGFTSPSAVDRIDSELAIITGGSQVPDSTTTGDASLFVTEPGGTPELLADLEAYELANNPDGQLQFDPETNEPLDALSNPFAVMKQRGSGWVLVADAGANAILSVSREGEVSTFFVPPLVTTGSCAGRPNNDPEHVGCDPVPTGLAYGPNETIYVSTLSGQAPGEGRVYVLNANTGEVLDVISGLDGPTGVEVGDDGSVYVSEVTYGLPDGPPPDDLDPATIGRIVRIAPDGTQTYAQVPMPTGLSFHGETLYASTWSVAGLFLGIPDKGEVLALRVSAFS